MGKRILNTWSSLSLKFAIMLWLATVMACNSRSEQAEVAHVEKGLEKKSSEAKEFPMKQRTSLDPESFEYLRYLSDAILEEIPRNLVEKYIGTDWDDENDPLRKIYSEDTDHYQLYDHYVLTFSVSIYGVSSETILATFTTDGKRVDYVSVEKSADVDFSATRYSSQSFDIFADSLLRVSYYRSELKGEEEVIADSLDFFDLESRVVNDTMEYVHYVIQRSGEIVKVDPQRTILDAAWLRKLPKAELRLMRNEFFARLGYIFESEEMKEYFERMDWYTPQHEDVTDRLTAFDRYNIELVRRIEDEK